MKYLLGIGLAALIGCISQAAVVQAQAPDADDVIKLEDEPVQPLVSPTGLDGRRVKLGRALFKDVRLSKTNTLSCATCHNMGAGGTMAVSRSLAGVDGKIVPLNIPTVIGSGLNFAQFWDGRAPTLEEQINGPTQNHDEMSSNWPEIIGKLKQDAGYVQSFQEAYQSPPTPENIRDAIATFERSQVFVDSPFDRYLRGEKNAISPDARKGYQLFKNLGCASCHQGANIGGNMYQKFGIVSDYFAARGHVIPQDYGRYNVTHDDADRYFFKVPSLRNVALTAPYFHDGTAATLDQAVDTMATYQLGRTLSPLERHQLVEYLRSLTGKPPAEQ
jgi:cytochrome c peroxidase